MSIEGQERRVVLKVEQYPLVDGRVDPRSGPERADHEVHRGPLNDEVKELLRRYADNVLAVERITSVGPFIVEQLADDGGWEEVETFPVKDDQLLH